MPFYIEFFREAGFFNQEKKRGRSKSNSRCMIPKENEETYRIVPNYLDLSVFFRPENRPLPSQQQYLFRCGLCRPEKLSDFLRFLLSHFPHSKRKHDTKCKPPCGDSSSQILEWYDLQTQTFDQSCCSLVPPLISIHRSYSINNCL